MYMNALSVYLFLCMFLIAAVVQEKGGSCPKCLILDLPDLCKLATYKAIESACTLYFVATWLRTLST